MRPWLGHSYRLVSSRFGFIPKVSREYCGILLDDELSTDPAKLTAVYNESDDMFLMCD